MAARQEAQYAELCARYEKLIKPFAQLHLLESRDGREKGLIAHWPREAFTVALSLEGRSFSSPQFSAFLGSRQRSGRPLVFVIGGADGLSASLKQQCALVLSLSALTLPHQLSRLCLLEQIYRGFTILQGHPYHR
jgi:23S rRNA (pseudouridine1915-N3)-methyltransferase